jgi:hypothetical protein
MNTHSGLPVIPADLRMAVLSNYTTFSEDGSLCYVSDKVHRNCAVCGTVFSGSATRLALGGGHACPFCRAEASKPLPEIWWS